MNDRKMIARIVYWANNGGDWREIANLAGYQIDEQPISGNTVEYRLSREGEVRGLLACVDGEFYGFAWVPEARHWRDRVRYFVLRTAPA
jgi:surface antigen